MGRAMVNRDWINLFPSNRLINLVAAHSYHFLNLLTLTGVERENWGRRFCFENLWLLESDIGDVKDEW